MRILFYSNWYVKQTVPLANALAAGHEVAVIFPHVEADSSSSDGCVGHRVLRRLLEARVRLSTLPHMQSLDPLGLVTVLKVRRFLRRWKPEVVHFNESYDFRCLLLMALCPGPRFVTTVHDPLPHAGEKISLHRFKHWVRDQIRRRSHGLVVYGENLRAVLAEYSGLPEARIHAVPHGEFRYYAAFDGAAPPEQPEGEPRVLFFGRWEEYKGLDVLIDAEPMITARVPQARIVLAGEGRLTLDQLRPRMAHPDRFEIRNHAIPDEQVPALFLSSDVVVLPYREANQSGPLHIAGTFARPAVVTRVGAMPEVVRDGETGLLVPPDDPGALAEAVCRLLENPAEARRMGQAAQEHLAASESMEATAAALVEVYQKVTSGPRRRGGLILSLLQVLVKKVKRDPRYALDESLTTGDVAAMLAKLTLGFLRGLWHRPFLAGASGLCFVGSRAKLRNRGHITVGRNFVAEDGCEIQGLARRGLRFGDNVTVGALSMIRPSGYYGREIGEGLVVGDRSNIGPYCYLGASGGITIGNDVMMGPRVSLFAENHNFARTDIPMRDQGVTRLAIVVEDDCWLASGSVILAGVTIGRGSIIAAGAVVTRDIPPWSIAVGNPARVLRSRIKTPETVAENS